jgi:hypothetical protein
MVFQMHTKERAGGAQAAAAAVRLHSYHTALTPLGCRNLYLMVMLTATALAEPLTSRDELGSA